jgi:GNAT superfamily N-acetyltransferase
MNREWSTRAYREGDEEKIYELRRAVRPSDNRERDLWLRWWRWMYRENPAGEGLIRLAEADGRVVAQHMMVPLRLLVNGQTVTACMGMEAMTHPDYRRQGLFNRLTREVFDDAAVRGIEIQTGMPNELSGAQYAKINGWFKVANPKVLIRAFNWKNVIGLKISNKSLSGVVAAGAAPLFDKIIYRPHSAPEIEGLTITEISSFDERFDRLWDRFSGRYPIITIRDSRYLNWRYHIPGIRYSVYAAAEGSEVRGYITMSERPLRTARVSYVADMIAESEPVMHCLISKAVLACRLAGVDLIAYSLLADEAYYRVLRRNGFMPYSLIKNNYLGVYSRSKQISRSFLQNPSNWFFQHADTDTI